MKDVRLWIDKSRQALESPQNKKRPLRDQLGLREKMISDITIQKTKISISVEKLQVRWHRLIVCLRFIEASMIFVGNNSYWFWALY